VPSNQPEKRSISLGACRVSESEFEKLGPVLRKYGMRRKSDFFRTCLEKLFEADAEGNLQLPIDLARTAGPRPPARREKA
jgi:hypothetical protein